MGKNAPIWKGKIVDRDYLKSVLRSGFKRCAKGNIENEIGRMVNDLERYLTGELLLNTKEVMQGIRSQIDEAEAFLGQFAEGVAEDQIRRRAMDMEGE